MVDTDLKMTEMFDNVDSFLSFSRSEELEIANNYVSKFVPHSQEPTQFSVSKKEILKLKSTVKNLKRDLNAKDSEIGRLNHLVEGLIIERDYYMTSEGRKENQKLKGQVELLYKRVKFWKREVKRRDKEIFKLKTWGIINYAEKKGAIDEAVKKDRIRMKRKINKLIKKCEDYKAEIVGFLYHNG